MILWDKRKALDTVMARRRPTDGASLAPTAEMKNEVVKTDEGEIDGRHLAAQDMIAAFHEKSPEKLMQATANFMDLHLAKGSEPEDDE